MLVNAYAHVRLPFKGLCDGDVMTRLLEVLQARGIKPEDTTLLNISLFRDVTTARAVYRDDLGQWWYAEADNQGEREGYPPPDPDAWDGWVCAIEEEDARLHVFGHTGAFRPLKPNTDIPVFPDELSDALPSH